MLLLFGSVWMFPLITALVAGDIVAAEDRHGTLKTILTRSVERHQIFAGKALATATYAILAIVIMRRRRPGRRASSPPASTRSPRSPARRSRAGRGLGLVWASLAVYLIPILVDRLHRPPLLDRSSATAARPWSAR